MEQCDLYKRFGCDLNLEQAREVAKRNVAAAIHESLKILYNPNLSSFISLEGRLGCIQINIVDRLCRLIPADVSKYIGNDDRAMNGTHKFELFLEYEFGSEFKGSFEEWLVRVQLLLNVIYEYPDVMYINNVRCKAYDNLAERIELILADCPTLGLTLIKRDSKAAQIYPSTSKKFAENICDVLGLLEKDEKYRHVLVSYECGLKEFLQAKEQFQLKDVVEDMLGVCDELVKVITNTQNRGFGQISGKDVAAALRLPHQLKESLKQIQDWMDKIKHGTIKDYDKHDVEMIMSIVGAFVRYVINKQPN